MANNDKENKIEKFTKEAIGKTLNQFNKEIGMADLVEINKNQDRILNGILSQVNDENTEKTEKSNIITLDNSTDGIVELKEIQGDTNVNVSKIEEMPITHDIGEKEGNVFTLNEITKGAISIGEIQGNTMVNCNKDDKKELVLMKDLSTQGDNNITLIEGVDGGKVDVALEGNTLVNVSKTKDSTAISKAYTVENSGNHISLQGDIDGSCRPVVTGNTLVNCLDFKNYISKPPEIVVEGNKLIFNGSNTFPEIHYNHSVFKPNTEYTIIGNVEEKTEGIGENQFILFRIGEGDGGVNTILYVNTIGRFKIKFTTPANIVKASSYLRNTVATGERIAISELAILEGDYTDKPIPDYFEGLQSSFEDRVVPESINNTSLWIRREGVPRWQLNAERLSSTKKTLYNGSDKIVWFEMNSDIQGIQGTWLSATPLKPGEVKLLNTPLLRTLQLKDSDGWSTTLDLTGIYLIEGDYIDYDFSDYDPTKAGKYKVDYKVTGKNKFHGKSILPDYITSNEGVIQHTSGDDSREWAYAQSQYFISLPPGSYIVSIHIVNTSPDLNNNCRITLPNNLAVVSWGYDKFSNISSHNKGFTLNTHTVIGVQLKLFQGATCKIQIEEGTTATSYEPYKEGNKTLYLNSPLLKGDTIEERNGGIYHVHKYGKVVLDEGASPWGKTWWESTSNTTNTVFSGGLSSAPYEDISYCDKLPITTPSNLSSYDTAITVDGESIIRINIPKTLLSRNKDLSAFRTWLNDNPVTLVGKLKTPQYELIEQSNLAIPSYANGHLDFDTAVPVSKVNFLHFEEELVYLYPSTSYTLQFVSDKAIAVDITLGGTQLLAQNIVKGLNRISITTPATLVDNKLVISGVGASISNVVVTDTNREFMYFEGMKSVGECEELEVKSGNKNLFDINGVYENSRNLDVEINGSQIKLSNPQLGYSRIDYIIPVNRVSDRLELSYKVVDSNGKYFVYLGLLDKDKKELKFKSSVQEEKTIILEKDVIDVIRDKVKYCMVSLEPAFVSTSDLVGGEYVIFKDILLVDDKSTDYIPHQSNTQQLTHEPLRGVGNVKDRYVLIDGKWYIERKYKEVVLDGSTVSGDVSSYFPSNNSSIFFIRKEDAKTYDNLLACDKFKPNINVSNSENRNVEGVFMSVSGSKSAIYLRIFNDKLSTQDINGFKQWLRQNPVTVVYELAEPVYEPIDYNPLEVYSDTTHISTNSAIPTNITIKNHGFNCLLKPSTTYTVSSNRGLSTVTTGADIGDSCLRFYDEDISDKTIMKNVLLLEGDWTSKANLIPCNFSGIESAFEQEYDVEKGKYKVTAKVVGKNLLGTKVEAFLGRPYGNDIYTFQQHPNANAVSYIIPCLPNTTYSLSSLGDRNVIAEFNHYPINGEIVTNVYGRTITTSNTAKWLVVYINSLWTDDDLHAQLEEGNTATAYEPYKESNVTFYLNEPLRGVENSKDRVFIQGDKVIVQRNCGSYTFDGSDDEYWEKEEARFSISISNVIPNRFSKAINNALFTTDSLVTDDQYDSYAIINGWGSVNKLYLRDINKFTTLAELKQYLQQNPVTVVYELASPTYEEVEYSSNRLILNTFNNESFNNSTLFLDTTILPKLSFKPLYEKLVYVKNSTKYYIQFNAVGSGEVVINLGGTELTTEIVEGYNCIPITTPSESTNLMTISGQGITISEVIVSEVVCGGYYKGLQSCFEEHMENGKYRVLLRGIALDGSKVNGIKLYINEPLRGVENVKDRLCIKNGKLMVERKCGEIKLDENSNIISLSGLYLENTVIFKLDIPIKNYDYYICDNFECYYSMSLSNKDIEGTYSFDNSIRFRILRSKLNGESYDDFKQWLQQNPVTVVYQLAEPVYEEATNEYGLPIVFEGYENGIVYIDSAVTPTTHIKYTSNNQLATTLSKAEEQNIATQEDINMNVVTYMMDIDMILTEMEMSNDTSVMAVRRDSSNENMLDRMSEEDKKVYQDNTVVMLEKMITANVLEKEDIEGRINMYYNKNRISKEQYEYLKSLL